MYWNVSYNARPECQYLFPDECHFSPCAGNSLEVCLYLGAERCGGEGPAVTLPPGELMYMDIGFSGLSASRKSN